jgi:hypothetical protein
MSHSVISCHILSFDVTICHLMPLSVISCHKRTHQGGSPHEYVTEFSSFGPTLEDGNTISDQDVRIMPQLTGPGVYVCVIGQAASMKLVSCFGRKVP